MLPMRLDDEVQGRRAYDQALRYRLNPFDPVHHFGVKKNKGQQQRFSRKFPSGTRPIGKEPTRGGCTINTYRGSKQQNERRVVPPPDAVVHPLAVVVAPVHAIVALPKRQLPMPSHAIRISKCVQITRNRKTLTSRQ